jgi:23S rRNA pseudouridine2605 synthase
MTDSEEPMRLNKLLAQSGVCSRRHADELIASGRVSVNGVVVHEMGSRVDPWSDAVAVDGREIAPPGRQTPLYLALNKPVHVVTTASDPQGRRTVFDLLPEPVRRRRPFPIGRLDYMSEGLLLMTTDGELAHRAAHPRHHLEKVYRVEFRGAVPEEATRAIEQGMVLKEGTRLAPVKVEREKPAHGRTILRLTLIQGVNRQIRRMAEELGLTILRLVRIAQGPVQLGSIRPGDYRELTAGEVRALKGKLGMQSGAGPASSGRGSSRPA